MPERKSGSLIGLFTLLVALQICLGLIGAGIYLSSHNTLYNNGNWTATKANLAGGIIGSQNYVFNLQTLGPGRLGMSAWYGYQEVVSTAELDPASVEFDFFVKDQAHLTFEFNRTKRTFNGIRLSAAERFPPLILKANVQGEFLRKRPFAELRRAGDHKWHTLRVEFEDEGGVTVFLDGRELKTFGMVVVRPQRIGFRGSLRPVAVDNIRVVSRDGSVFFDDFSRPANWRAVKAIAVAMTLLVSAGLYLLLGRVLPIGRKLLLFYFLMLTVVLIVIGLLLSGITWHRKKFYPNASEKLRRVEAAHIESGTERMLSRIEKAYSLEPDPGVQRILFVGSSQTRGSGAAKPSHTLVKRTEKLLNQRFGGSRRFECLNVAVRGHRIASMREHFENRWVHWKPDIAIVNAGNNDLGTTTELWEKDLTAIINASRRAGIQLVFIPEANSVERRTKNLHRVHASMKKLAESSGIPVIDMFGHLSRRADDGFLWWDWVHLTSFGQKAFAEHLVDELARLGLV